MIKILYPFTQKTIETQSFDEHVQRAASNGWCSKPGTCPSGIYYYGGIDYGVPIGTPVHAVAAGTVTRAEDQGTGYGKHVRIQHDGGYLSVYGHLVSWKVSVGDKLSAGDIIGHSGNTGNSTGPHLHLELRLNGIPIDPEPLFVGYPSDITNEISEPTPAISIKIGDRIKLKDKWNYVNIRNGPGTKFLDCGNFKPGDAAYVVNKDGDWLCVYRLASGFGLWVYSNYVEKV